MRKTTLSIIVTLFMALTIAADDGQIPIGGKTSCQPPAQCQGSLATESEPGSAAKDADQNLIDGSTIIAALQIMQLI
jgi:hypothetical protein